MKETSISTKVIQLDLDVILQNYNKPKFWKKKWTIYKSKALTIITYIDRIDVKNNKIYMTVKPESEVYVDTKSHKIASTRWLDTYIIIPIDRTDYTRDKFLKDLTNACMTIIRIIELKLIKTYSEYENASKLMREYRDSLRSIAEDFLDENKVTNSDIREAYIEVYINHSDIPNYCYEVERNMEYTVIPQEYLMCAAFMGSKEIYNDYAAKCKKVRKSTKIKIWLAQQEMKTEEFVEKMKGELDAI